MFNNNNNKNNNVTNLLFQLQNFTNKHLQFHPQLEITVKMPHITLKISYIKLIYFGV